MPGADVGGACGPCRDTTVPEAPSHPPTLPPSHPPTLPPPPSHPPTLPPSLPPTLPPSHPPTLPPSHPPTLPPSHPPTLPPPAPPGDVVGEGPNVTTFSRRWRTTQTTRSGGGGGGRNNWNTRERGEACGGRPERGGGVGAAKTAQRPLITTTTTPRHTDYWAPRTRKRHQQEHRPQRPTERSDPTQHAKGRTGDCPGPCKETTTRRNVTRGGGGAVQQRGLPPGAPGHVHVDVQVPPLPHNTAVDAQSLVSLIVLLDGS